MKDMLMILDEIEEYVLKAGGPLDAWHVGVAMDVQRNLADQGVRDGTPLVYARANSPACARNVVRFLLYRGMKGDLEYYDKEADLVYVYKKSDKINP